MPILCLLLLPPFAITVVSNRLLLNCTWEGVGPDDTIQQLNSSLLATSLSSQPLNCAKSLTGFCGCLCKKWPLFIFDQGLCWGERKIKTDRTTLLWCLHAFLSLPFNAIMSSIPVVKKLEMSPYGLNLLCRQSILLYSEGLLGLFDATFLINFIEAAHLVVSSRLTLG